MVYNQRESVRLVMTSTDFTLGEKQLLEHQLAEFCNPSAFTKSLFDFLYRCDGNNLAKMRVIFPEQVDAVLAWQTSDLAQRFQTKGIRL